MTNEPDQDKKDPGPCMIRDLFPEGPDKRIRKQEVYHVRYYNLIRASEGSAALVR